MLDVVRIGGLEFRICRKRKRKREGPAKLINGTYAVIHVYFNVKKDISFHKTATYKIKPSLSARDNNGRWIFCEEIKSE